MKSISKLSLKLTVLNFLSVVLIIASITSCQRETADPQPQPPADALIIKRVDLNSNGDTSFVLNLQYDSQNRIINENGTDSLHQLVYSNTYLYPGFDNKPSKVISKFVGSIYSTSTHYLTYTNSILTRDSIVLIEEGTGVESYVTWWLEGSTPVFYAHLFDGNTESIERHIMSYDANGNVTTEALADQDQNGNWINEESFSRSYDLNHQVNANWVFKYSAVTNYNIAEYSNAFLFSPQPQNPVLTEFQSTAGYTGLTATFTYTYNADGLITESTFTDILTGWVRILHLYYQ